MYGLCRLPDAETGQPHVVLINWVGEKVSEERRQVCAGHLPAIRGFFKEAHLVVKASQAEEVTQDGLKGMLSTLALAGGAAPKKPPLGDSQELVGTNYKKTNPVLEILHTKRSSFWAQAEREEEERRQEERRRAQEERRHWERQRMEEERREAAERERRIQEKEQLLQEQRKQQAQREAEERRHEEAARRGAATLSSQPTPSPRDLFRQRERSGSTSGSQGPPSSPGGQPGLPRRPFLRHQRSLTESAYIFRRPDPPPSPTTGGVLPSASPPVAPLPSPRRPKPPPPIGPKPGAGAPPPVLGSGPLPTEAERPPPSTPVAPQAIPRASPLPAARPVVEGGRQAAGGGCLPSPLPPAELAPSCSPLPPSPSSPPGPHRASPPPLCTHPPARSPPPTSPLPPSACCVGSSEAGPVTPPESPQREASRSPLLPGGGSPLAAPPEEPQPSPASSGPSSARCLGQGGDGEGGPPPSSPAAPPPPQEGRDASTDGSPAQAEPESVPYSRHNGVAVVEGEKWAPGQVTWPSVPARSPRREKRGTARGLPPSRPLKQQQSPPSKMCPSHHEWNCPSPPPPRPVPPPLRAPFTPAHPRLQLQAFPNKGNVGAGLMRLLFVDGLWPLPGPKGGGGGQRQRQGSPPSPKEKLELCKRQSSWTCRLMSQAPCGREEQKPLLVSWGG
ncbi:uncharacterized protein LOC110079819 isoform X2 [Pogona vitticeps]